MRSQETRLGDGAGTNALDVITTFLRGTSWGPDTIEDTAAVVLQTVTPSAT
jgi:hypothetical protein